MHVTALIPARGGSKGVLRKNIRPFCGVPLFLHSVRHARAAETVDRVVVSTEDAEIYGAARRHDVDVLLRPDHLAEDDVPTRDVEDHAIRSLGLKGALVTLHPTSPLRIPSDIDACVEKLTGADACRTITEADPHPYLLFERDATGRLEPYTSQSYRTRTPRQAWPAAWADNGAVWARRIEQEHGGALVGHVMPPERSVDIDAELDWRIAEMLMRERGN